MACIVTISCFNINLNGRQFLNANGKRYCERRRIKATKEKKDRKRERENNWSPSSRKCFLFSTDFAVCHFCWNIIGAFSIFVHKDIFIFFFPENPDPKLQFTTKIAFYCPARGFGYTPDSKYKLKNLPNGTHSISFILASKKIQLHGKIRKMAKSGFCRKFCFELQQFALITADKTKITFENIV